MTSTFKLSLTEKARIYAKEIHQETFDSIFGGMTWSERIRYEALPMARYQILKEMRNRAAKLPLANFNYDGRICRYSSQPEKDHQLILEFPKNEDGRYESVKYISAQDPQGKIVVAAMPFGLHREIVEEVKRITGKELTGIKGGRMNIDKKRFRNITIRVYGSSHDFGKADHQRTVDILRAGGLEATVAEETK